MPLLSSAVAFEATRWLLAACLVGAALQGFLSHRPPLDAFFSHPGSASSAAKVRLLLDSREEAARAGDFSGAVALIVSVISAQLGLLALLCCSGRLSAACHLAAASRSAPAAESDFEWSPIAATAHAHVPLGRLAWHTVLGFSDWRQLCAVGTACRALCAEAREDAHWVHLWEQLFGEPWPHRPARPVATSEPLKAGPILLADLRRWRKCRACSQKFRLMDADVKIAGSACRIHPGVCQLVNFYPAVWRFSCCGESAGSEGCRPMARHVEVTRI